MCTVLAAMILTCLGYVPDRSKVIVVPRHCVRRLEKIGQRERASQCAADNGVMWKLAKRKRY